MTLSIGKILLVLAVVAVIFGYRKLPEIGKSLGESLRNFKKGVSEPEEIDITPAAEEKPLEQGPAGQETASPDPAAPPRKKPSPLRRPMPGGKPH